jgi:hypothetical protein
MAKERINISLDTDVIERIDQYAQEQHTTRSGALTQLILNTKVSGTVQIRGQLSLPKEGKKEKNGRKED